MPYFPSQTAQKGAALDLYMQSDTSTEITQVQRLYTSIETIATAILIALGLFLYIHLHNRTCLIRLPTQNLLPLKM